MTAVRTKTIFHLYGFCICMIEQFDMLPIQYRHIEHMHKGVCFGNIIFDKMTSIRT